MALRGGPGRDVAGGAADWGAGGRPPVARRRRAGCGASYGEGARRLGAGGVGRGSGGWGGKATVRMDWARGLWGGDTGARERRAAASCRSIRIPPVGRLSPALQARGTGTLWSCDLAPPTGPMLGYSASGTGARGWRRAASFKSTHIRRVGSPMPRSVRIRTGTSLCCGKVAVRTEQARGYSGGGTGVRGRPAAASLEATRLRRVASRGPRA